VAKPKENIDIYRFDQETIRNIASNLVNALDYLHNDLGIVHRDIKPENIIIGPNGNAILSDFGKAKVFKRGEDLTSTMEGTY